MKAYVKLISNNWLGDKYQRGEANGYVILPVDHPFYGLDHDFVNQYVTVHGGLTYSSWEKNGHNGYCYGFDTLHLSDTAEKWSRDAVYEEAIRLMEQFNKLATEYTKEQVQVEYTKWMDEMYPPE